MPDSPLNFDRDIAPERNNFGFNQTESSFANAKADQQIMPQLDLMVKLRGQLQREKAADLAYDTSVFEFKQRKKSLRDERAADQKAEDLLSKIQSTVEDEDLSPFEQREKISLLQLQNSDTFANSRVAQQSLLAANSFLQSQMQQRNEKLSRKIKRKSERRAGDDTVGFDVNYLQQYMDEGQVEELEKSYGGENSAGGERITGKEATNIRNASAAVIRNKKALEKLEKQEREVVDSQVFRNTQNIAQLTLDEIEENLKAIDLEKKVGGENPNYSDFDGVTLPDGTVLEGIDPAVLKKTLRNLRSKTRKDLADASIRRNKFLKPAIEDPESPKDTVIDGALGG